MAYYWTCTLCGSNLDHGEKCTCTNERTIISKSRTYSRTLKPETSHACNSNFGLHRQSLQKKEEVFLDFDDIKRNIAERSA